MRKSIMKWGLSAFLAGIISLTTACSVAGDSDDLGSMALEANDMPDNGIYEGEWTVNKQVVDTAQLVVAGTMRVRLPERYLLGLCFPDGKDKGASVNIEPRNAPATIQVYAQGYSEQSQYMTFASATTQAEGYQLLFNTCSFDATINGVLCHFSLLSRENASAILQYGTEQWTLAIPVNTVAIMNSATGQTTRQELSATVTLYYNTKKRIR